MTQSLALEEVLSALVVAFGGTPPSSGGLGELYEALIAAVHSGGGGSQGAQGSQGTQGAQGSQGNQGTQGPGVGSQGAQGAAGAQGTQGHQGFQGVQGSGGTGPQGAQGTTGTTGLQGNQGQQGPQGNQGFQGTQGHQGFQGTAGSQGAQGATGSGSQGAQGTQGAQGPSGGAQGAQGSQGGTGAQGNQGFQGASGGGGGGFPDFSGAGSPEGVQTAVVGKSYVDTTNGGVWWKLSGSGNTGWALGDVTNGTITNAGTPLAAFDQTGGGYNLMTTGASGSFVYIGDVLANAGTVNGLYWSCDGTDGQQLFNVQTGSTGQFEWNFNADGTTDFPGPINAPANIVSTSFSSGSYTLALTDASTSQQASNGASTATITVPPNASVVFPIGSWLEITQTGSGKIQIAQGSGVTIRWAGGFSSGTTGCRAEYSVIRLLKVATNTWVLSGDAA